MTGNSGLGGGLELRFPDPAPLPWPDSHELYAFIDGGVVWDAPTGRREGLSSTGLGVRMQIAQRISAYLEAAVPLRVANAPEVRRRGPRIFFGVSSRF